MIINIPIKGSVFLRVTACAAVVPVVWYTGFLAFEAAVKSWMVGWESPLVFIGFSGIMAYLVYGLLLAVVLLWLACRNNDKVLLALGSVVSFSVILYLMGIATSAIGKLP